MTKLRVIFMGTPDFAVPCLDKLVNDGHQVLAVVTQPDRPKGRGLALTPPPVKTRALALELPVLQPPSMREPEVLITLQALRPELIVTVAFGQLLPVSVLHLPALGAINVHASLLPKLRGGAPIHWAVMNGERETGITTMHMARRLDAGDIILQRSLPITDQDTTGTLHDKLAELGAQVLGETVELMIKGQAPRIGQNEAQATYAPNVSSEDQRLDWNWSSDKLVNRIRGLDPWPGAYTIHRDGILKIWSALRVNDEAGIPGQVTRLVKGQGFVVKTGDGSLLVKEIQPAGKRRMAAAEFIVGNRLQAGEILGQTKP